MMKDYYMILGVHSTATHAEIKTTYKIKVKFYHPDRWPNNPRMRKKAEELTKEIIEAYAVLSDPDKRRAYDAFYKQQFFKEEPYGQSSSSTTTTSTNQSPPHSRISRVLPELAKQGYVRNLKFGHIHNAYLMDDEQVLLISAGGVKLLNSQDNQTVWDIDCPSLESAISADKNILALGGLHRHIHLWDLRTQNFLGDLKGSGNPIVLNKNGALLACGNESAVSVWDTRNRKRMIEIDGHKDDIRGIAFSPDGQTLATASYGGTITWPWQKNKYDNSVALWDIKSGREIQRWQMRKGQGPFGLIFSPNGRFIAIGKLASGGLLLRDLSNGEEVQTLRNIYGGSICINFSSDERFLALGSFGSTYNMYLWDMRDNREVWRLEAHQFPVDSVDFSPSGRTLVSVTRDYWGSYFGVDEPVRIWDVKSGKEAYKLGYISRDEVYSVAFSPDGRFLASGGGLSAYVWDVSTGQEIQEIKEDIGVVYSVAVSPDGNSLASGGLFGACLWDIKRGWQIDKMKIKDKSYGVNNVVFSPNGQNLAVSLTKQPLIQEKVTNDLLLWNITENRKVRRLKGHFSSILHIAFSPNGQYLASASVDRSVILWNVASCRKVHRLRGHKDNVTCVAFSANGEFVASGSRDKTVILWKTSVGQEIKRLGHNGAIYSLAFSPDKGILASGIEDGTICIWDLKSGRKIRLLEGHTSDVFSLAFSPDGQLLASGSWDGTVRLWQTKW
jgi:WD40 repeat protein